MGRLVETSCCGGVTCRIGARHAASTNGVKSLGVFVDGLAQASGRCFGVAVSGLNLQLIGRWMSLKHSEFRMV